MIVVIIYYNQRLSNEVYESYLIKNQFSVIVMQSYRRLQEKRHVHTNAIN